MKSHERRISQLEDDSFQERKDVPDELQAIYDLEDNPESEMANEIEKLYNPNRKEPFK